MNSTDLINNCIRYSKVGVSTLGYVICIGSMQMATSTIGVVGFFLGGMFFLVKTCQYISDILYYHRLQLIGA